MTSKAYAGIGSRKTPPDIQKLMTRIAERLAEQGWTLRSGHADGADLAFEKGAGPNAEIYLPWAAFNQHYPIAAHTKSVSPTQAATQLASEYHPAWKSCGQGARLLHSRNMHQILGADLKSPVRFVICWTPDGEDSGGTGQALRLARARGIEVFNLFHPDVRERLQKFCAPKDVVPA